MKRFLILLLLLLGSVSPLLAAGPEIDRRGMKDSIRRAEREAKKMAIMTPEERERY